MKALAKSLLGAVLLVLTAFPSLAACPSAPPDATCPIFSYGFIPTPAQWQNWWNSKQNALGYTPLPITTAGQYPGTITNNQAAAGNLGEVVLQQVTSGSAVSLTTATAKTVTSTSLTAGDWDCTGTVDYTLTGSTTTHFKSGMSTTNNTFGSQDTFVDLPLVLTTTTDTLGQNIPRQRLSLATTTTVYLVAAGTFSAGSEAAYGTVYCRRAR